MKKLIIIASLFFLCGCKIDFTGDLYTSDLINLANSKEEKIFNLPMEIAYQVTSCEGTDSVNRIISTYFIEYNNTGCDLGEDFMSYVESKNRGEKEFLQAVDYAQKLIVKVKPQ